MYVLYSVYSNHYMYFLRVKLLFNLVCHCFLRVKSLLLEKFLQIRIAQLGFAQLEFAQVRFAQVGFALMEFALMSLPIKMLIF